MFGLLTDKAEAAKVGKQEEDVMGKRAVGNVGNVGPALERVDLETVVGLISKSGNRK